MKNSENPFSLMLTEMNNRIKEDPKLQKAIEESNQDAMRSARMLGLSMLGVIVFMMFFAVFFTVFRR